MRLNPAQLIHWLPCPLIFCAWTVAFQIKHREGIITTKCINYGSFNVFTAFPIPDPWSKGFNAFRKSSQTPLVHDKVCTGIELLKLFHIIPFFLFEDNFCLWTLEHWSNFSLTHIPYLPALIFAIFQFEIHIEFNELEIWIWILQVTEGKKNSIFQIEKIKCR